MRVLDSLSDRLTPVALTAHRRWEELSRQCREFQPQRAVIADPSLQDSVPRDAFPPATELQFGPDKLEAIAADADTDIVIAGIVGAAGLRGTWAAVEAGKTVGIANKETLVVAGPLMRSLAERSGATLIPVDSEHSAIFQAMQTGRRNEVKRVVLTASGGPFRGFTVEELADVTPEMALAHPTWDMGPKITIDSATLMNKAMEVIEARWLFDLTADQISVVVHPQSVAHSFVEFVDGSVIAQLSPPDMMLPIQYALTYPDRTDGPSPRLDWETAFSLDFEPPDLEAFPGLALGFETARRGGTCGAVLNAANEVAVERFLDGRLRFVDIPNACRDILNSHEFIENPTLSELLRLDAWAREETGRWF